MKHNKKLLLGAISAMAVMAIGTGAVSTFAWYQAAAANVTLDSHANSATLTTTATASTDTINAYLVFTITLGTNIEPTSETDGKVY